MTDGLSELGEAAVAYAESGLAVFPIQPRGKRPNVKHGVNDWTDDPEDVRAWWSAHPSDNIGIACGQPSGGLLVLDFDVDEEREKDGMATLSEWERVHGDLPETAVAITGGGGMHYLYRTDRTNIHPSVNQELGVDVRCDGSYIVAPPSVHPSGRRYEWQDPPDETPIATATGAVYDFLDHVQRNGGQDETRKDNGKFRLPDKIAKGARNPTLFKYASHLRSIGRSDEEILASVMGVNAMRCEPPMDSREVERICRSACRYEQGDGVDDDGDGVGKPGTRRDNDFKKPNNIAREILRANHACHIDGAPAVWTGTHWEFGKMAVARATLAINDDAKQQDRNEVFGYLQAMAPSRDGGTDFDGRYYVQFANCTYDVLADEIVEPRPEMFIIATLPVELDMDVPRNLADEFLEQIAVGDPQVKTALCEVIGACMCSKAAMEKSIFLVGRARAEEGKASNGKSTFIRFLRSILGGENCSSIDIATMGQRFRAGSIVGKLANLGDDIPDSFLNGEDMAVFKKVVTGEVMETDVKNGQPFEFKPTATMVFSMNNVPRIADVTGGTLRRLHFIPFRAKFTPGTPGFDRDMAHRLAQSDVLRRGALLGLMALGDLIRRGEPTHIPEMDKEIEDVKKDNDSVTRWLYDEEVEAKDVDNKTIAEVYDRYTNWCDSAGERNRCSKNTFTSRLRDSGYFGGVTVVTKSARIGGHVRKTYALESI